MAKGKHKNLINRNQDHSPSSESSTPILASPGQPNTLETQDSDLKSYLMMLVEDFKKSINNSLKEIQENTAKEAEVLKELQENTPKVVMELNKTMQALEREVETIKKDNSEDRNPRKKIRNHRCEHQKKKYKRWKRDSQVQKIP
jgi:gas vesicle protein